MGVLNAPELPWPFWGILAAVSMSLGTVCSYVVFRLMTAILKRSLSWQKRVMCTALAFIATIGIMYLLDQEVLSIPPWLLLLIFVGFVLGSLFSYSDEQRKKGD